MAVREKGLEFYHRDRRFQWALAEWKGLWARSNRVCSRLILALTPLVTTIAQISITLLVSIAWDKGGP